MTKRFLGWFLLAELLYLIHIFGAIVPVAVAPRACSVVALNYQLQTGGDSAERTAQVELCPQQSN